MHDCLPEGPAETRRWWESDPMGWLSDFSASASGGAETQGSAGSFFPSNGWF